MHTNMCGPFNVQASREYKYFITFTDDYSEYGYVYLRKFVVVDKFKEFKAELENQLGKRLQILRFDRGGEYMSNQFDFFLKKHVIMFQLITLITP